MTGKLTIQIMEARLERDTATFGKMDVYAFVESRMQRIRTNTMESAGKEPSWPDEMLVIDVKYVGDDMRIALMDENWSKDDVIGESVVKLSAFCCNGGLDEWYVLQHKGKPAGHAHLKSTWEPDGAELEELPEDPPEPPQTIMSSGQPA